MMSFEPRAVCLRCRRPESVCYCAHIRPIETQTRVILLQHPRERDVPIGTARMAHLCLPNSDLHVTMRVADSPSLRRELSDPSRPAVLLYPGSDALDLEANPPSGPVTLVVVDGTWWQARSLVRDNPELRALPRYAFLPLRPSEYRIRAEPHTSYVSTIEAVAHALGVLDGGAERFASLLEPFRAMVDAQVACASKLAAGRVRHAAARKRRADKTKPSVELRERAANLVCIYGEANAWPHGTRERAACGDELVHWVAVRPGTGETFEAIVAVENLAPRTSDHAGVAREDLATGESRDAFAARWRAFLRDDDLACTWGPYPVRLLRAAQAALPVRTIDVRKLVRDENRGTVGSLDEFLVRAGGAVSHPFARGRAGRRVSELVEAIRLVGSFRDGAARDAAGPADSSRHRT